MKCIRGIWVLRDYFLEMWQVPNYHAKHGAMTRHCIMQQLSLTYFVCQTTVLVLRVWFRISITKLFCMLGNFSCFCCCLLTFFKIIFFKTLFRNTIRVSTFVCLIWHYIPVNNLSVMLRPVFLGWTSTNQGLMCLAQGHNAVTPVRLEPVSLRSWVKHSTTEFLSECQTVWKPYQQTTKVVTSKVRVISES